MGAYNRIKCPICDTGYSTPAEVNQCRAEHAQRAEEARSRRTSPRRDPIIPDTAEGWELYTSMGAGADRAARDLSVHCRIAVRALVKSALDGKYTDALFTAQWRKVDAVFHNYQEFGAEDSEPSRHLERIQETTAQIVESLRDMDFCD